MQPQGTFDSLYDQGLYIQETERFPCFYRVIDNNNNNLLVFPYRWCYLNAETLNKNSKTKQNTTATRKKNKK